MAITKPQLDIAQALTFATEQLINKNIGKGKDKAIINPTPRRILEKTKECINFIMNAYV